MKYTYQFHMNVLDFLIGMVFLSSSLDSLVKAIVNDDFEILKKDFLERREYLTKKTNISI